MMGGQLEVRTAALACLGVAACLLLLARRRRRTHGAAHTALRDLGRDSGLQVTVLGQGGAPLGDLFRKLDDTTALKAVAMAHELGIAYYDTSPWYGTGLSEMRCGLALHRLPRTSFVFQTKVGRYLVPDPAAKNGTSVGWIGGLHMGVKFDYSASAFERQIQDSLQRTGLGYIDSVVIHDLEPTPHRNPAAGDDGIATACRHLATLRESGFAALQRMRADGVIKAFGAGVNIDEDGEDEHVKREWNREYVRILLGMPTERARGIDFLLLANMHSLLSHEASSLGILDDCLAAGVAVVIGGPYSSGILATGADPPDGSTPKFNYQPASEAVRARVRRIERVCDRHGVPLIAAALQYPLRHPAVCSVIPGGATADEVASNVALLNATIPEGLWQDLERERLLPMLLPPPVKWLR